MCASFGSERQNTLTCSIVNFHVYTALLAASTNTIQDSNPTRSWYSFTTQVGNNTTSGINSYFTYIDCEFDIAN